MFVVQQTRIRDFLRFDCIGEYCVFALGSSRNTLVVMEGPLCLNQAQVPQTAAFVDSDLKGELQTILHSVVS